MHAMHNLDAYGADLYSYGSNLFPLFNNCPPYFLC